MQCANPSLSFRPPPLSRQGIISALRERAEALKSAKVHIFVRR